MKFARKTIEELFTASNRYQVPDYQRGYAWKKSRELEDFWADLCEASAESQLYLGALILQKKRSDDNEFWQIVDGQQRITTISLLLVVCRNLAIKNKWPQANTLPSLIASQNIAAGGVTGLRVEVGQNINPAYRYLVEHPEWDENNFPSYIDGRRARILKSNYLHLMQQMEAYDEKSLANLLTKILNHTFFLVIEVEEELQAFDIFERTNARGAPLNIGDLLKNRLFANADSIPNLQSRWDKIVTESDSKLPRVLKYFTALFYGQDTGRPVLFQHLRDLVEHMTPPVFMDRIEEFARFFNSIDKHTFTKDPSHRIANTPEYTFLYGDEILFLRVKRSLDALQLFKVYIGLPAIYAGLICLQRFYSPNSNAYAKLKKEYIRTLNVLESFHFINNQICTEPTNKIEPIYAKSTKVLYEASTAAEAVVALKKLQQDLKGGDGGLASEQTFVTAFKELIYSPSENKPDIAYIFDRFNQGPFETPSISIYEPQHETVINRLYEIEHISPKSTWEGEEDVVNNIGNLLVLTKKTNRQVDNKILSDKIKIYKGNHFDNLVPVKDLVEFVEKKKIGLLTPEIIEERAVAMARKAYKIWNPWQD